MAENISPRSKYLELVDAAADALRTSTGGVAEPVEGDIWAWPVRELLQMCAEYADAIFVLASHRLYRAANVLLRSMFESMATAVWIESEYERNERHFNEGQMPNVRARLERIGWAEDYERTFKVLSSFVHPSPEAASYYDDFRLGGHRAAPDIEEGWATVLALTPEGYRAMGIGRLTPDEATDKFEPALSAKVLDLTVCGLAALDGSATEREWWPGEAVARLQGLCASRADVEALVTWKEQGDLFRSP